MRTILILAATAGLMLATVQAVAQQKRKGAAEIQPTPLSDETKRERGERGDKERRRERRGGGGEAGGERPDHPAHPVMMALDRDRDGELSSEEIEAASRSLARLDRDRDGTLSREELRPRGGGERGGFMSHVMKFDENGDGQVSAEELPERMQGMMERADTNQDGVLDQSELQAVADRMGGNRGDRGPRGDRAEKGERGERGERGDRSDRKRGKRGGSVEP